MSENSKTQATTMFWVVSVAALVWNLIGLLFYYTTVTMSPETLATFPENQQAFFNNMPSWATAAYAIAVTAGVVGSVLLLLRKAWAVAAFALSLLGILVQNLHAFAIANGLDVFGAAGAVLPAIVIAIAIGLVLYARVAKRNGAIT